MSENKQRRTTQITVRLEPKILDGLSELADRFGIAPTTLAGLAIGEFVAKNQAAFSNAQLVNEIVAKEIAKTLVAPFSSLFENKTPDQLLDMVKHD